MRKCLVPLILFASACGLAFAPAASAIPACEGPSSQKTIYSGLGVLESIAFGGGGKLYVSATESGFSEAAKLFRFNRPGAKPRTIATAPPGPGGLTWNGRRLLWGNGNTLTGGQAGDENPQASLLSVNPRNGKYFTWARGLGMANGLTRSANGMYFASNDFGLKLDRVSRKGVTRHGWANVESGNGMVVGRNGKYLFVNQTFVNPGTISRIEIRKPANVKTWFSAAGLDNETPAFDGLARDGQNNLYAAAWAAGEVWKITRDRQVCALATGIGQISNLAFGGGKKKRFSRRHLYAVNFLGDVVQIKGARRATIPAA